MRTLRAIAAAAIVLTPACALRAEEITLAAGAGFRRPIAEVAAAYEKEAGHRILQVYGHLGQVIAQARESGRISVVCGDLAVLKEAKGLALERTARLGLGKLVVAFRKGLAFSKVEELAGGSIGRVGMPDQTNAIYGKAGRQFLERSKLAQAVDPKLIVVATVPQVTSYIASGEIDAGFVNATDAIGAGANIGGFVEVDAALYDPVEVACSLLAAAKTSQAANGFADFLETPPARAILKRYGL